VEQSWVGEAWLRELLKVRKDQQEIEIWDEGMMEEEEWCQRDKGKERGYKLLTKTFEQTRVSFNNNIKRFSTIDIGRYFCNCLVLSFSKGKF
jgi:hypothetical protein